MRSSASSSNDRLPRGGWGRTWALTLLLVFAVLAALELGWRAAGFSAEVQAMDEAWLVNLHRLPQVTTVALGSSRIRAALDPDAFQGVIGGAAPINLGLPGASPIPALEYLADSTPYAGLVLVEIMPLIAFDAEQRGAHRITDLLDRYRRDRVSPARLAENWLQVNLLHHLILRTVQLLPARLAKTLWRGGTVHPDIGRMRPDGFAPKDWRSVRQRQPWDPVTGFLGPDWPATQRVHPASGAAEVRVLNDRVNRATERVLHRGGTVVLLYMGACGVRHEFEERLFPRARYWDPLAHQTHAIAIATEDYPELSRFDCYDGSHIDAADAPVWAAALGRVILAARDKRP